MRFRERYRYRRNEDDHIGNERTFYATADVVVCYTLNSYGARAAAENFLGVGKTFHLTVTFFHHFKLLLPLPMM